MASLQAKLKPSLRLGVAEPLTRWLVVQPPKGEAVFRCSKPSVEDVVECVEVAAPRRSGYEDTADLVVESFECREVLAVDLMDVHGGSGYSPFACPSAPECSSRLPASLRDGGCRRDVGSSTGDEQPDTDHQPPDQ